MLFRSLYGTTTAGGTSNEGAVFLLTTSGAGFHVVHSFTGTTSDGNGPAAGLTLDGSTLYGTTQSGGAAGDGISGDGAECDH